MIISLRLVRGWRNAIGRLSTHGYTAEHYCQLVEFVKSEKDNWWVNDIGGHTGEFPKANNPPTFRKNEFWSSFIRGLPSSYRIASGISAIQFIMSTISPTLDARNLIEVKPIQKKGLGIFARERIPRGTRILAESPLLKAAVDPTTGGVNVKDAFNNLTGPQQRAYLELYGYASEDSKKLHHWEVLGDLDRKVLAIYTANCWGRDVFWLASRFNHSCIPNIHNAYNATIHRETFHTIREIEAGEELTVSYIFGIHSRRGRQAKLSKWGFECTCLACEDTIEGRQIENQLCQLATIIQDEEMSNLFTLSSDESLRRNVKMAAFMRAIGLVGKSLNNCYRDIAFRSAVMGNVKVALLWAEKEVEIDNYCLGKDHPDYPKEVKVLEQLKAAAKSKKPFHYMQIEWVLDWDQGPE